MYKLSSYQTHNDGTNGSPYGRQINAMSAGEGINTLFNPVTGQWEDRLMQAGPLLQDITTALVDGVASGLVNRKPHYASLILKASDPTTPVWAFSRMGFGNVSQRYGFERLPDGSFIPRLAFNDGTKGLLMGMVLPKEQSIGNIMGGVGAGIRCSSLPGGWRTSGMGPQSLPINTGPQSITVNWTTPQDLGPLGLDYCTWAWMGPTCGSTFSGRVADSNGAGGVATLFFRPYAYSYETGGVTFGNTLIHQFKAAGSNDTVSFGGIDLAFDDGAWYYGAQAWVGAGQKAYLSLEHKINGWT